MGRLQLPPVNTRTSGVYEKLGGGSGGLFTALGRGGGEGSLPPSNLLHLFFFLKKTPEYTPSPNTMNTELAHWGPAPAWGQGSRLMHFGRQGGTWLKVLGSCRAHSTR